MRPVGAIAELFRAVIAAAGHSPERNRGKHLICLPCSDMTGCPTLRDSRHEFDDQAEALCGVAGLGPVSDCLLC